MKWLFYIAFVIFFTPTAYAQNVVDETVKAIGAAKDDSIKLQIYSKIFNENKLHNIDTALTVFTQGYALFQEHKYLYGEAKMLLFLGALYEDKGIINVAKDNYNESLQLFTKLNHDEYATDVINALGVLEGKTGNYEKATGYFLKALKRFVTAKNNNGIVNTYIKLGTLNEFMGNLEKSLDYYKKALSFTSEKSLPIHIIHLYNNIGALYCRMGDNTQAIYYLNQALTKSNSPEFSTSRILTLTNLGIAAHKTGNDRLSANYYATALQIAEKEDLANDQARILLNMSSLEAHKNDALLLLDKALNIVGNTGHKRLQSDILSAKFLALKRDEHYKEALNVFEQMKAIDDSITGKEKQIEIANLETGYELSQSKEKVNTLKISQARIWRQRNLTWLFAALLLISLAVVIYFLLKLYYLNKRLRHREDELEALNQVKDQLFTIIGHDLKSPINNILFILELLIQNRLQGKTEIDTLQLLRDDALVTLQALDNLLNWSRSQLKGEFIKPVTFTPGVILIEKFKLLKNIAERKQISMVNRVKDDISIYADVDHFKLIARNLLYNALKFTPPGGSIIVSAEEQDEFVVFEISDNGVGINEERLLTLFRQYGTSEYGTANEKGNGIGLMLCKHFVEENGGQIWAKSIVGEGTTFFFSLRKSNTL